MNEIPKNFDWKLAVPLMVTITLAFSGYYYTYQKDLHLSERKDRLERVNRQLRELYGPLYALSNASSRTWSEFRKVYRPSGAFWDTNPPPTKEEAAAWRLWMKEVFMPLNLEMEALILKHSDLLVESVMPEVLLDLSAHIAGYKAVIKSWDRGDLSRNVSLIGFPGETLSEFAKNDFRLLKTEQMKLLGELEGE